MRHLVTESDEAQIKAALEKKPHASAVARESPWSYSTVWRVADRNGILLTAGRETMGRNRVSAEQRAMVIEARRVNPNASQNEIAHCAGVSRSTVRRIEGNGRLRRGGQPKFRVLSTLCR
jgi:DNA-binding XRE family transcriptional regulator